MFHSTFIRKVGKGLSVWAFLFLMAAQAFGQIGVTVTNPTNTTPNLLATYPNFTAAVADLNLVTAMSGPVTLTLAAGTSETAPIKGFNISTATAGVLNATNTLTIVKAAGAATVINAGVGTANGPAASPDGMLYLNGSDYVTIDGLTFTDGNSASATVAMEFGIAFFKRAAGDGCNNNTIQNCIFNMQRINNATSAGPMTDGSCAIQVLNSTAAAAITALTPTNGGTLATNGTNSNNRFYNNQINNGNAGIHLGGFAASAGVGPTPTPTTFLGDLNNDIGGTAAITGNTILNFGGGAATNPAVGIRANNQWSVNIRYNTINNNNGSGVSHATTLRGIFAQAGTSGNATISNNTITIIGGGTTTQVSAIENAIGSTAASNTVDINSNTITGNYNTATSGNLYVIYNTASAATVNINNNGISNMNYSAVALAGSGLVYPIFSSGAATTVNITGNTISNITRTGTTGGTTIGAYTSSGTNQNISNNNISTMSIDGSGTASTLYGIQTSTGTITCNGNTVHTLSCIKTTGTGVLYGIYNIAFPTVESYNNNTVHTLSHAGTGILYGIYAITVTGTRTMSGNTVHTLTTAGTTIAGLHNASSSPSVFQNRVYNIQSTNAGATTVSGILQGSLGTAGVANIYNNLIGDLKAPNASGADCIRGINITTATATASVNVYYNTVYLNASSVGANFGTSGIFHTISTTATTGTLTLRNNIIYNNSTPAGTGLTVAYRRSAGAANNLANYSSASNNNLFYAGTPGTSNLIYFDGTSSAQSIADYKTGSFTAGTISPRDGLSESESIAFQSTAGANANFLKYPTGVPMKAENGAANIATYTTDFAGTIRQGNAGYLGTGTAPDMGAWELEGIGGGCVLFPTATITPVGALNYCSPNGTPVAMTGAGSGGNGGPYTTTWSPTTQLWTNAGASVAYTALANVANVWATPASGTTYTLTVTDGAGCTSTATKTVNIIQGVTLPALTNSGPVCPGSTATLTSNASLSTTIAGYGFGTSSGAYTPISSGTVLIGNSASTFDDTQSGAVALPFTFNLAGINYTHFNACVNGWMRLGTNASVSSTNPTSMSSTLTNAIGNALNTQLLAPMWDDLYILGNSSDKVHYSVTGSSPNQVFTIEWFNVKRNLSGGVAQNFQIKLFENGNVVQFVYGACTTPSGTSASCGITDNVGGSGRFLSVNDFTLAATVSSTVASDAIVGTAALVGLTFTFTPAPPTLSYAWVASGPPADNSDFDDQTIAVPTVGPLGGVGS